MKKSLKKEIKKEQKYAKRSVLFEHEIKKIVKQIVKVMDKYGFTGEEYTIVLKDGRKFTTTNVIEDTQSAE